MSLMRIRTAVVIKGLSLACISAVASATQQFPITPRAASSEQPARGADQIGKPPVSIAGQLGRRQSEDILNPLLRVRSRVANRVQNRIHNRIDRYYDPKANTTKPFEVAADNPRTRRSR